MPSGSGIVYDVDFIFNAGWTQVLLQTPDSGSEIIAISRDPRIVSLVSVAYASRSLTFVETRPGNTPEEIVRVIVFANQYSAEGAVLEAEFDLPRQLFRGRFQHDGIIQDGFDDTGHAQQVVEAAIVSMEPVQYLTIEPTSWRIERLKVNHGVSRRLTSAQRDERAKRADAFKASAKKK